MIHWAHPLPSKGYSQNLDRFGCFAGLTNVINRPTDRPRYSDSFLAIIIKPRLTRHMSVTKEDKSS